MTTQTKATATATANRAEVEQNFRIFVGAAKGYDKNKSNMDLAAAALIALDVTPADISDGGVYLSLAQSVGADIIVGAPGTKARDAFDDPDVPQKRKGKDTVKGKQKKAVNAMIARIRAKLTPAPDLSLIEKHLSLVANKVAFIENAIKADSKSREKALADLGGKAAAKKMLAAWDAVKSAYPKK